MNVIIFFLVLACGAAPPLCWNGQVPDAECMPNSKGVCKWMGEQCPPKPAATEENKCKEADCGKRPAVCWNGQDRDVECLPNSKGVCKWMGVVWYVFLYHCFWLDFVFHCFLSFSMLTFV